MPADVSVSVLEENLKRGLMELLILQALCEKRLYGYEMVEYLNTKSGGKLKLKEGSLYGPLYRLIDKKCVAEEKVLVGKRRTRIYFTVTEAGREYLRLLREVYLRMTAGVAMILETEADHENGQG
ncbi:MAG: helix-turn-helix transcriptional regulator [Clostridia bacterium]|nr:helix-turn-helix transcriptional regulator [Clostridia bacterium]